MRRKTTRNNHPQGTGPLLKSPFIQIIAIQRLRLFCFPLTFICIQYYFWFQGCFLHQHIQGHIQQYSIIHSFTRSWLQALSWRRCWPGRQGPSPQSFQADGHSRRLKRNSNQRCEWYSGGEQGADLSEESENLPEGLTFTPRSGGWGLSEAP